MVEAIAPVLDHTHQYAVVTRARTTATRSDASQDRAPARHVALATVTQVGRTLGAERLAAGELAMT